MNEMLHFALKRALLAALDPPKWEKKSFLDINLKQFWIFWYQLLTVNFLHRMVRLFKVKAPFFGCDMQKNMKKLFFFPQLPNYWIFSIFSFKFGFLRKFCGLQSFLCSFHPVMCSKKLKNLSKFVLGVLGLTAYDHWTHYQFWRAARALCYIKQCILCFQRPF